MGATMSQLPIAHLVRVLQGSASGAEYATAAVLVLTVLSRFRQHGSTNLTSNKIRIQQMIDTMPPKWAAQLEAARKEQRNLGLPVTPKKPTVDQIIDTVLEITAGNKTPGTSNWSGERGAADVSVSSDIREAAMAGLELSHKHNYPSFKFLGLARGMQLATRKNIWRRSQKRAKGYLGRHQRDKQGKNWGNPDNPSKGWMAYLIWGGEPAWKAWRGGSKNTQPFHKWLAQVEAARGRPITTKDHYQPMRQRTWYDVWQQGVSVKEAAKMGSRSII
jgi:hypothetical protein